MERRRRGRIAPAGRAPDRPGTARGPRGGPADVRTGRRAALHPLENTGSRPRYPRVPHSKTMNPTPENPTSAAEGTAAADASFQPAAESPMPLEAQLADLQARHAEVADAYLRAKADAENTRRRADEEMSKARKFAVEAFAESLLPVKDSLEAAIAIPERHARAVARRRACHLAPADAGAGAQQGGPDRAARRARSSTRTSTRPSASCRPTRRRTRWSPCCRRATSSPSACCARLS